MGRASVPTPALYPAFFFVLEKAAKPQETQPYQRFRCIGHTDFNTFGTNGPRSLSRMKAGAHSPLLKESHTVAHRAKQGVSDGGWYHYPRSVPHVLETLRGRVTDRQTLPLLGLGRRRSRRTTKAFGTAMRSCASPFRGVAAPLGCVIFFYFCRNCDFYALRSGLSARAKEGVASLPSVCFAYC